MVMSPLEFMQRLAAPEFMQRLSWAKLLKRVLAIDMSTARTAAAS